MIYNGEMNGFPLLEEALNELGVCEESIKLAVAYLDTDNERDNTLLEKIKLIDLSKRSQYQPVNGALLKANKNEIRKKHSPELLMRYALVAFAIAGSYANYFYERIWDNKEEKERFMPAFTSAYGKEEGEIRFYTILSHESLKSFEYRNVKFNPETFLKAAVFQKEREPENSFLLAFLSLLYTETGCTAEYVKTAADMIIEDCKNANSLSYFAIAVLAEASAFSDEAKSLFRENLKKNNLHIAEQAFKYNSIRILDAIADTGDIDSTYISEIHNRRGDIKHLRRLAKEFTDEFIKVLKAEKDAYKMEKLQKILSEECPDVEVNFDELRENIESEIADNISKLYKTPELIKEYVFGKKSFDEIYPSIQGYETPYGYWTGRNTYYTTFGCTDFLARCVSVLAPCVSKYKNRIEDETGFNFKEHSDKFIEMLRSEIKSPDIVLDAMSKAADSTYYVDTCVSKFSESLEKHLEFIKDADASKLSVTARRIYISALGKQSNRYKAQFLSLASDTSKVVREILIPAVAKTDCHEDICELLKSKKAAMREFAVAVIEKQGSEKYTPALNDAFATEKSEKLKNRIAVLIGEKITESKAVSADDELKKLTSPAKTKKLDWLYKTPFTSVMLTDGTPADDSLVKGLMMCYAADAGNVNPLASKFAEKLDKKTLEKFACEVFGKWLDDGAVAKQKWILYFSAVYGGNEMIDNLMHYIKEWSENSRGAIAAEAVYALALNGSSNALMKVDNMAHKFKKRQVKDAANYALLNAAEKLGISKEELGDRIVPDMNFDERMCRTFDYGNRQFSVYLTPSLEIEIFSGDKKIKNLPKPGASDDAEKAEKAYADFKDMKKQMKTVVKTQHDRLEYVLMCDRKWSCENWKKLFVANPVMHCFAIGLIWGTYEEGKLVSTFRYLDDGSFTTSDEDEFELPDDAVIGLVHPIELSEDEKMVWIQQLADYEIVQPFAQLTRPVFTLTDDEKNGTKIMRFDGNDIINQTLVNRLTKFGWEKGSAQDAGCFYEFYHHDITEIITNDEGKKVPVGFTAELKFSGTYIGVFELDPEEVTIEELVFHKASEPFRNPLNCSEVNPRYFSEIIAQLTSAVGTAEE